MATINHIKTPDGVIHNIGGGGGGSTTYTLTKSGNTITLTGSGGDVSSVTDANTTYTLSISGDTLTLTPSSGSAQSVTIPDDDTTYTINVSGSTITLTPSSGSAQSITIPDATTSVAGVMSASDKTKLDGIQSGAEANVQSDWNQSDNTADDYIKNKPTIPTVNNGTLTIQQNGTTLDTFTANQSGNTTVNITTSSGSAKKVWFGTSSTSASTGTKVVTTDTADYTANSGDIVFVAFTYAQTAAVAALNVDSTGAAPIYSTTSSSDSQYMWTAGEIVGFVFDGTNYVMIEGGVATTARYGVTKLSSAVTSTATGLAATPSAVKQAYDLADSKSIVSVTQTLSSGTQIGSITVDGTTTDLYAPSGGGGGGVTDVEVNGTSVVTGGVAQFTVPTATSDLVNDSDFVASTSLATVATSGSYADLSNTPNLATVATSGSYLDLSNTPTILTLNDIYPVHSVYVADSASTDPNNLFTGQTWTLFDKEFTPQWITTGFTFNTTNTQSGTFGASLAGHAIEFRFTWQNKSAVSDSTTVIGTMNNSAVGITTAEHRSYPIAYSDGLNAIVTCELVWSSHVATLQTTDYVTRATSIPTTTGQAHDLTFTYVVGEGSMLDSFCNKFYWKRTA